MAVSIRLRRGGKKKKPFYRIVAADSRASRDGRFIEVLGFYNPIREEEFGIKTDRVVYWIGVGAKPSDSVRTLLQRKGMWKDIVGAKQTTTEAPGSDSNIKLKSTKTPDSEVTLIEEKPELEEPETEGQDELLEEDTRTDEE